MLRISQFLTRIQWVSRKGEGERERERTTFSPFATACPRVIFMRTPHISRATQQRHDHMQPFREARFRPLNCASRRLREFFFQFHLDERLQSGRAWPTLCVLCAKSSTHSRGKRCDFMSLSHTLPFVVMHALFLSTCDVQRESSAWPTCHLHARVQSSSPCGQPCSHVQLSAFLSTCTPPS